MLLPPDDPLVPIEDSGSFAYWFAEIIKDKY